MWVHCKNKKKQTGKKKREKKRKWFKCNDCGTASVSGPCPWPQSHMQHGHSSEFKSSLKETLGEVNSNLFIGQVLSAFWGGL